MKTVQLARIAVVAAAAAVVGWKGYLEGAGATASPSEEGLDARREPVAWNSAAPATERVAVLPPPGYHARSVDVDGLVTSELAPATERSESELIESTADPISREAPAELSPEELETWVAGRALFTRVWEADEGLGAPGFNGESCATCHVDPVVGGAGDADVNVIQVEGEKTYDPRRFEGNVLERFRELREIVLASKRPCRRLREFVSRFVEVQTPSLLGLGAIDSIPEWEIRRRADPHDLDGDGIRGREKLVRNEEMEHEELGRFGWRAEVPRLADFVCMALSGETGLTTPDQGRGFGLSRDFDRVADPELEQPEFDQLLFFVSNLEPPRRKGGDDPEIRIGEGLFRAYGCVDCHVPSLLGEDGPVPLYSDLLLHDVSPPAADEKRERAASSRALRTPPLWGVGDTPPYLHDGSAADLRAAVLAHDGEARLARESFERASELDREALLLFLRDL